mgnify:CR=1 FL=1
MNINNVMTIQELVAEASDQNRKVDKKTLELMRKYLEQMNQLKQGIVKN